MTAAIGGHFFVGYSRVDAAGFALQLADRLRVEEPAYRPRMHEDGSRGG